MKSHVVRCLGGGVPSHLVSSLLQCRQQSVEDEELSGALYQLFINLQDAQDVKHHANGLKNTINWQSYLPTEQGWTVTQCKENM